jgi:hypothetical protein
MSVFISFPEPGKANFIFLYFPPNNVSEILQLVEIKVLLIAPGLCHFHGMMECWNIGSKDAME